MKLNKMDDEKIISIINAELNNAPMNNSLIEPLEYYLGLPNGQEQEGRSQLTSTDVADSIEWIMPQVMKSFTQTNEIVIFDPINQNDELQAELESEYVYNILMKKNDGFICIHEMVKDALLQRNGILKVYYEDQEKTLTSNYSGLSQNQLEMLAAQKNVELAELSESIFLDEAGQPQVQYDAKISITKNVGKICVKSVPPEEFRVNSNHNSINLDGVRFSAHVLQKTVSELIEDGVDPKLLEDLSTSSGNASNYRMQLQNESVSEGDGWTNENEAMRLIQVIESYIYMDYNNDGIAEYCKVTGIGDGSSFGSTCEIRHLISVEELDYSPWVSTTAILMSHKFQGLSIYDRIKEIQDHKTALTRNIMDNIYLQNNQRNKVLEGQVNMDDLMLSRPGGNVRVKRLDAMEPIITPQIGQAAFDMVRYLDEVRAGRVGVSAEGSATPQNIGDRVGSEGVDRLMSAKEELVGLIVRVIAETGIKPLMLKIRDLARQHVDTMEDFKFRGRWVQVNPSSWNDRSESTVRVGTGSGDTRAKLAAINQVIQLQAQAFQVPGQALVNPNKIYSAVDDFCTFSGLNGASKYFVDPGSPEGQQATQQAQQAQQEQQAKQDQQSQAMIQMEQQLAQAEIMKAQAQQDNVSLKGQVELAKHQREMDKLSFEAEKIALQHQLDFANSVASGHEKDMKSEFDYDKLAADIAIRLTEIEASSKTEQNANYEQNKGSA